MFFVLRRHEVQTKERFRPVAAGLAPPASPFSRCRALLSELRSLRNSHLCAREEEEEEEAPLLNVCSGPMRGPSIKAGAASTLPTRPSPETKAWTRSSRAGEASGAAGRGVHVLQRSSGADNVLARCPQGAPRHLGRLRACLAAAGLAQPSLEVSTDTSRCPGVPVGQGQNPKQTPRDSARAENGCREGQSCPQT